MDVSWKDGKRTGEEKGVASGKKGLGKETFPAAGGALPKRNRTQKKPPQNLGHCGSRARQTSHLGRAAYG